MRATQYYYPADQAVVKTSGSASVSNFRWINNGSGNFCVGFDFDNLNGGKTTMKANADKCQADGVGGGCYLGGNGKKPNGDDKKWTF